MEIWETGKSKKVNMENTSFFKQIPIILRYKAVTKKHLLFIPFLFYSKEINFHLKFLSTYKSKEAKTKNYNLTVERGTLSFILKMCVCMCLISKWNYILGTVTSFFFPQIKICCEHRSMSIFPFITTWLSDCKDNAANLGGLHFSKL